MEGIGDIVRCNGLRFNGEKCTKFSNQLILQSIRLSDSFRVKNLHVRHLSVASLTLTYGNPTYCYVNIYTHTLNTHSCTASFHLTVVFSTENFFRHSAFILFAFTFFQMVPMGPSFPAEPFRRSPLEGTKMENLKSLWRLCGV